MTSNLGELFNEDKDANHFRSKTKITHVSEH